MEFGKGPPAEPNGLPTVTNDILAMLSPEQEKVPLQKVYVHVYIIITLLWGDYMYMYTVYLIIKKKNKENVRMYMYM